MGDPYAGASWSMGYSQRLDGRPPIRADDGGGFEVPGNDRSWWESHLNTAISAGLGDLQWYPSETDEIHYWGVSGVFADRSVMVRIPRLLEHRDGLPVADEVMVVVEYGLTLPRLGSWVIEAPSKWFRGRRGWALNRPKLQTGDPWFDEHAGCWAWDCADGAPALRDALTPLLPMIREVLDAHPGAVISNAAIATWIPYSEMPTRLPKFLAVVRSP